MKRLFFLFFVFISVIYVNAKVILKDDAKNILKLNKVPNRIIVLSPEINEIIFDLRENKRIIANTEYCDYPAESKKILKVGSFNNPDIEKIISLKPDLIFLTKGVQKDMILKLRKLKYDYFVLYISSVDELFKAIEKIAEILDVKIRGNRLIKSIKNKLGSVKKVKKNISILPIVWANPVMVAGNKTLVNDVIKSAGGKNIMEKYKDGYFTVSEEFLIEHIPDYILLCGNNINLENNKIFKLMKKQKKFRIIKINPDWFLRATPRITKAILKLNKILVGK